MTSLDPYATTILGIKNALKEAVNGTVTFHDKVSFDYISAPPEDMNPFAHGSILRDSLSARGVKETTHILQCQIDVVYICQPDEAEFDKLVEYIGEIVDALEDGDRKIGAPDYVDRVEVNNVTYGYLEGDQALLRTGRIMISIHSMRNM